MTFSTRTRLRLAASAAMMVAGLGTAVTVQADGGDAGVNPTVAARAAQDAQRSLSRGRMDRAIASAEAAVAADPNNPEHRALLARTYLTAGRYVSADESFDAALALGASDSRTVIGAAMALIANERAPDALALLDRHAQTLPVSDLGLALALAGAVERGVMVLSDVARAPDAAPRDRQNLALAYALGGRWLEARLIAAQDIGPQASELRMQEWTRLVQTRSGQVRIAALLGHEAVADPGMPERLALDGHVRAPQLAASEDPAPLALYAPRAEGASVPAEVRAELAQSSAPTPWPAPSPSAPTPVEAPPAPMIAEAAPAATAPAPAVMPSPQPASASERVIDGIRFVSIPVIQPLRDRIRAASNETVAALGRIVDAIARPATARRARPVASVRLGTADPAPMPNATGRWAVQLGAYDRHAVAQAQWAAMSARNPSLRDQRAVTTRANVQGRTFYRLALSGYPTRAQAQAACARLGAHCFVRAMPAGDAVLWASRGGTPQRFDGARPAVRVAAR